MLRADFNRPAICTNYGKYLHGIPLMIMLKNLAITTKSRQSILKLTFEIRFSQNFKRHCQTIAFASRWLISCVCVCVCVCVCMYVCLCIPVLRELSMRLTSTGKILLTQTDWLN